MCEVMMQQNGNAMCALLRWVLVAPVMATMACSVLWSKHAHHFLLGIKNGRGTAMWELTAQVCGEPVVVGQDVGHVVIQGAQHAQGIINVESCVIVPKQDPFVRIDPSCDVCKEWSNCCPA